jgi:hypothetical protein
MQVALVARKKQLRAIAPLSGPLPRSRQPCYSQDKRGTEAPLRPPRGPSPLTRFAASCTAYKDSACARPSQQDRGTHLSAARDKRGTAVRWLSLHPPTLPRHWWSRPSGLLIAWNAKGRCNTPARVPGLTVRSLCHHAPTRFGCPCGHPYRHGHCICSPPPRFLPLTRFAASCTAYRE